MSSSSSSPSTTTPFSSEKALSPLHNHRTTILLLCGTYLALRVPRAFSFAHFFGYKKTAEEKKTIDNDAESFIRHILEQSDKNPAAKFLWSMLLKLLDYRKVVDCLSMVMINMVLREMGTELVDWSSAVGQKLDVPVRRYIVDGGMDLGWRIFGLHLESYVCMAFGQGGDGNGGGGKGNGGNGGGKNNLAIKDASSSSSSSSNSGLTRSSSSSSSSSSSNPSPVLALTDTSREELALRDLTIMLRSVLVSVFDYHVNLWSCCFTSISCFREVFGLRSIHGTRKINSGESTQDPFLVAEAIPALALFTTHTIMGEDWIIGGLLSYAHQTREYAVIEIKKHYHHKVPHHVKKHVSNVHEGVHAFGKGVARHTRRTLVGVGLVGDDDEEEEFVNNYTATGGIVLSGGVLVKGDLNKGKGKSQNGTVIPSIPIQDKVGQQTATDGDNAGQQQQQDLTRLGRMFGFMKNQVDRVRRTVKSTVSGVIAGVNGIGEIDAANGLAANASHVYGCATGNERFKSQFYQSPAESSESLNFYSPNASTNMLQNYNQNGGPVTNGKHTSKPSNVGGNMGGNNPNTGTIYSNQNSGYNNSGYNNKPYTNGYNNYSNGYNQVATPLTQNMNQQTGYTAYTNNSNSPGLTPPGNIFQRVPSNGSWSGRSRGTPQSTPRYTPRIHGSAEGLNGLNAGGNIAVGVNAGVNAAGNEDWNDGTGGRFKTAYGNQAYGGQAFGGLGMEGVETEVKMDGSMIVIEQDKDVKQYIKGEGVKGKDGKD